MHTRRELLSHSMKVAALLAAAGLVPAAAAGWTQAAFSAMTLADAMKALGAATPAESSAVTITGPDIAENGAVVPVAVATTLPGVGRLALLVEKNPHPLAAVFNVTDGIEPHFNIRVKMGQSSDVYAVALMTDGRVLHARKEIRVTLGGCGS